MGLQIFNTATRTKTEFVPLEPDRVKMYVCGPTVYGLLHIGNFRGPIFFNLVRNWLERSGYEVEFVYNYTDVDDKIIQRAGEMSLDAQEVAARFIKEFEKDFSALGLRSHSHNPRVTEFMTPIIRFIEELIKKGHAYQVDGDVYYDVRSYPSYGQLSHKKLDELESGVRIEVDQRKRDPADFALWKSSRPAEPSWDSPWGAGRPGWHIECSAMARGLLGDTIDIHGGGIDLVFPHHENEIAQSEGATGKPFVRYWMHNNMIEVSSQKMSKSLGNIRSGRSFLEEYNAEILKFMMLSAHYRSTIDFSSEQVQQAIVALARFYSALALADRQKSAGLPLAPLPSAWQRLFEETDEKIRTALDDDFGTPQAFSALFELTRAYNQFCRKPGKVTPEMAAVSEAYFHFLRDKGSLLALFQESPSEFLRDLDDRELRARGLERDQIDALVTQRVAARQGKNWPESDRLRAELEAKGIQVQDLADGSSLWEVAK